MKHKTHPTKKMTRYYSSPIPACFRPPSSSTTTPALEYHHPPPCTTVPTTTTPNLTTSLYRTHLGLFSLTWSRAVLARTLHLHLHPSSCSSPSSSASPSLHLTIKPFVFWTKRGVKSFHLDTGSTSSILVYWDFTSAKFGPGPEPESGYYIAVVSGSEHLLFVGDMEKEWNKIMSKKHSNIVHKGSAQSAQSLVVRREHVCGNGNQFYTTKTNLGGKDRVISIELNNHVEDDPRLLISFDSKRVLQVKHLKWKFRGSERVEVDGHRIQLSWDVYNWLFEEDGNQDEGYALFTFQFEKESGDIEPVREHNSQNNGGGGGGGGGGRVMTWSQDSCGLSYERKKMKKKLLVKTRSSSSSSLSSASSSGSSSVMEWESVEENELKGPTGFSLLVYAWKS